MSCYVTHSSAKFSVVEVQFAHRDQWHCFSLGRKQLKIRLRSDLLGETAQRSGEAAKWRSGEVGSCLLFGFAVAVLTFQPCAGDRAFMKFYEIRDGSEAEHSKIF